MENAIRTNWTGLHISLENNVQGAAEANPVDAAATYQSSWTGSGHWALQR